MIGRFGEGRLGTATRRRPRATPAPTRPGPGVDALQQPARRRGARPRSRRTPPRRRARRRGRDRGARRPSAGSRADRRRRDPAAPPRAGSRAPLRPAARDRAARRHGAAGRPAPERRAARPDRARDPLEPVHERATAARREPRPERRGTPRFAAHEARSDVAHRTQQRLAHGGLERALEHQRRPHRRESDQRLAAPRAEELGRGVAARVGPERDQEIDQEEIVARATGEALQRRRAVPTPERPHDHARAASVGVGAAMGTASWTKIRVAVSRSRRERRPLRCSALR